MEASQTLRGWLGRWWLGGFVPAFAALAVAVALHFPVKALFGPAVASAILVFIWLAVVLIAGWVGYLPGIAVVLTLGIPLQYLITPGYTLRKTSLAGLAALLALSLLVSRTAATRRRIENLLRGMNNELERRVREKTTALVEANAALRTSEEQFRTLANAVSHLCWMAHGDGSIFWYNDRWYDYTGTTPEQMEGWGWQSVHDPSVLPDVLVQWKGAIANGVDFEMIFPLRGKDGVFRQFLTRANPLKDEAGKVVRWIGTNTDIAERMAIEERLQKTNEALRRANEDLGQFAYVAAHDLQEPLRTVVSFSQLIQTRSPMALDPDTATFLGYVVSAGKRMSQLISDVLRYSRATSEQDRTLEEVNLNEVLAAVLNDLQTRVHEASAEVVRGSLPVVAGDPARLQQVFQNLLSNSLKYRKPGVPPKVEIKAGRRDGNWLFTFSDNGQGFNPDYAERIFGMFKRLHGSDIPGSGIGLAICKTIIERHGGRIWAEAVEGAGATFFFTLPVVHRKEAHA